MAAYVAPVKMPEAKLRNVGQSTPPVFAGDQAVNFVAAVRLILTEGATDEMILPNLLRNLLIRISGACFEALLNHR